MLVFPLTFMLVFLVSGAWGCRTEPTTSTTTDTDDTTDTEPTSNTSDTNVIEDADGDGFSFPEDCDDADPAVFPGADDPVGDRADTDCDGLDGTATSVANLPRYVSGLGEPDVQLGQYLSAIGGRSADQALVVGAGNMNHEVSDGRAWLVDDASGGASSWETLRYWFDDDFHYLGSGVAAGDLTGDGHPDVVSSYGKGILVILGPDFAEDFSRRVGILELVAGDLVSAGNRVSVADLTADGQVDLIFECGYRADPDAGWEYHLCVLPGPLDAGTELTPDAVIRLVMEDPYGALTWTLGSSEGTARSVFVGKQSARDRLGVVHRFDVGVDAAPATIAPVETWVGESAGDWFGSALATGDVDGDGEEELLVGAMGYPGRDRVGRVYALGPGDEARTARLTIDVGLDDAGVHHLGVSLAVADLDGDGTDDLVVGAPSIANVGPTKRGLAAVFAGPVTGALTLEDATWAYGGERPGDSFGFALEVLDFDGDGGLDLVVAAPAADDEAVDEGALYWITPP